MNFTTSKHAVKFDGSLDSPKSNLKKSMTVVARRASRSPDAHGEKSLQKSRASFREVIKEATAQIVLGVFDPVVALNKLGAYDAVPTDVSDELIQQLFVVIYECIPDKDYDFSDK